MAELKLSVVIASYNRRDALRRCIASLMKQDAPVGSFEVIVVLDGSSDGSREMLEALPHDTLQVLVQETQGQGAARNAGARAAKGEFLLILDDDFTCSPGLVSAHLAAQSGTAPTVVFGPIQASVPTTGADIGAHLDAEELAQWCSHVEKDPPTFPQDAWAGPNCSMPRSVFLECSGFDTERFRWRLEDVELGLRLWKQGLMFRHERRALAWHHWSKHDAQVWRDARRDGASEVALCRRHPEYRTHCGLAGVMGAAPWKRLITRLMAGFPGVANALLRAALTVAGTLPHRTAFHALSVRLYRRRKSLARLAGALEEAGSWEALRALFAPRLAVLLYHDVGVATPHTSHESLTVTPERLERHLAWLRRRGYCAITPSMWLAWRTSGTRLPKKPVMLTFDDGYANFVETALPILRRHGFGAAAFVITGKRGGSDTWEGLPVMTADQIRQCHSQGIEIGGHSRSHRSLTEIGDTDVAAEVEGSWHDLAAMGLAPLSFAYPFGFHDTRVRAALSGRYRLAFTCDEGLNDVRTDPLLLRRTMVQPGDTLLDIELRAALGWSPFSSMRSALRVRSRARRLARGLMSLFGIRHQQA